MFPGEYPQPLVRSTVVQFPVVASYVTARLQCGVPMVASGYADYATQVMLENNSTTSNAIVYISQTSDRSVSGTRTTLAGPTTLKPLGRTVLNITPGQAYLEFSASASSPNSEVKATLTSKLRWDLLGFGKDDTFYPVDLLVTSLSTQNTNV